MKSDYAYNQQSIWEAIAGPWKNYRSKPIEEVAEFLSKQKGKILDLGCGSGRNFVKIKGTIYGIDFSDNMLKFARRYASKKNIKVRLTKAHADNLPFHDNFFDAGIFIAVLHCIPTKTKRKKALKELLRVLKPNADAFITVWDKNQKKFKNSKKDLFIPWKYNVEKYQRYYYLYNKTELIKLLKEIGFEILKANDSRNTDSKYSERNIIVRVKKPISS